MLIIKIKDRLQYQEGINLRSMLIYPSVANWKNCLNPYKGSFRNIKIYTHPTGTWYQIKSLYSWIYPCNWLGGCFFKDAKTWQATLDIRSFCSCKWGLIKDEPSLNQSDKAKIDLQLINNNKQYRGGKNSNIHFI